MLKHGSNNKLKSRGHGQIVPAHRNRRHCRVDCRRGGGVRRGLAADDRSDCAAGAVIV